MFFLVWPSHFYKNHFYISWYGKKKILFILAFINFFLGISIKNKKLQKYIACIFGLSNKFIKLLELDLN